MHAFSQTLKTLIAGVCSLLYLGPAVAQVDFVEAPFADVLTMAEKQNKYVMVDAYTDWCGWCKVMDRETFSDSATAVFLDARFISTKVNMEEGFGIDLAMKYRVSSYPQYLFFDSTGALIARLRGFIKPDPFMESISEIFENKAFLPPSPDPLNFTEGFPDFLRNSYKKNKERTNPTAEEVEAFLDSQEDLTSEPAWAVVSRFVGGGKYAVKTIENRALLIEKYGQEEVMAKLSSFVFNDVKTAIKQRDEAMLDAVLSSADVILGDEAPAYKIRYRLYFYQMTENWDAYAVTADKIAGDPDLGDPATINQMAWTIYEKTDSKAAIDRALSWMKTVVDAEPTFAYLDTYAALLYKDGQKEPAMNYAQKALEAGTEEEADTGGTEALLERIKAM